MGKPHEFDCPYCDHSDSFDWPLGFAAAAVCWHFFWEHGHRMFRVGCPLFDDEPPEPEEFNQ